MLISQSKFNLITHMVLKDTIQSLHSLQDLANLSKHIEPRMNLSNRTGKVNLIGGFTQLDLIVLYILDYFEGLKPSKSRKRVY